MHAALSGNLCGLSHVVCEGFMHVTHAHSCALIDADVVRQDSLHVTHAHSCAHIDAGDGEDVARHDTQGAGSDCLSDIIGTSASLMQPALPHAPAAVHVRPAHAIDGTNNAINRLHSKIIADQEAADSPKIASPKRKAIALQPGPVQPQARKRRRQLARADSQVEQPLLHCTQKANQQQQQQQQHQQAHLEKHSCPKAFLRQYGVEQADATVVDFLEMQLGRITHAEEHPAADMAEVITLIAHDIHTSWTQHECPLECITAQFASSITSCAAAPASHDSASASQPSTTDHHEASPDTEVGTDDECLCEDKPLAKLWCSPAARQNHTLTWLLHCASQLDALLSSNPQPQTTSQTTAEAAVQQSSNHPLSPTAAAHSLSDPPAKKRRGRPPGSKNKKTLQRLEAAGLPTSPHSESRPGQQQQQEQAAARFKAAEEPEQDAPDCLQQLRFLTELHKKVVQVLGVACHPKRSGPFEAEVCCLSAAAALLCRVMGQVQVGSLSDWCHFVAFMRQQADMLGMVLTCMPGSAV